MRCEHGKVWRCSRQAEWVVVKGSLRVLLCRRHYIRRRAERIMWCRQLRSECETYDLNFDEIIACCVRSRGMRLPESRIRKD